MGGIDISHYQKITNYSAAKNAIDWVFIKACQGTDPKTNVDASLGQHYTGFNGKPRGLYCFTNMGNIQQEVALFASLWRQYPTEMDPMLDAECAGINSAYIKSWIAEWRRQTGHQKIWVYSSVSLFKGACNPAGFSDANTPLWPARYYTNRADFSTLGWDHPLVGVYQYWDKGTIPGIEGDVDLDISRVPMIGGQDMTDLSESFVVYDQNGKNIGSVTYAWAIANMYGMMFYGSNSAPWKGPSIVQHLLNFDSAQNSRVSGSTTQLSPLDAAMNADAYGYETVQQLETLAATINTMAANIASESGISADAIKAAVAEALQQSTVKVDINVEGPQQSSNKEQEQA